MPWLKRNGVDYKRASKRCSAKKQFESGDAVNHRERLRVCLCVNVYF